MQAGRETKFRAWDKENKAMRYGVEQAYNGHWQMNDIQYFGQLIDNPKYELMQFTGLRDKDGKEIYEGDIVRRLDWESNYTVKYDTELAMLYFHDPSNDEDDHLSMLLLKESACEVIGNIYENPELLEVE